MYHYREILLGKFRFFLLSYYQTYRIEYFHEESTKSSDDWEFSNNLNAVDISNDNYFL